MSQGRDGDFGFNSEIYSDHKLCLRRKRKRNDDGDHPHQVGVVKVVLARASAFFKAIFETPMQDADTSQGVTYISLDDEDSGVDHRELQAAYLHVLRCAHMGALPDVPSNFLPVMLHLADKYLFNQVAELCARAMEDLVQTDRELAVRALSFCNCPESLALKCIDSLLPHLDLAYIYVLLDIATDDEAVIAKARAACNQFLVQEYAQTWQDETPPALLELEFPAFELLLQSDELVVRSENVVFMGVTDWIRVKPSRKKHFDALWRHVRKYYLTTGYLLEVVAASLLLSERDLLSIVKKRLGSLYRYEWGKPRNYKNPPLALEIPPMMAEARWVKRVICNAVDVTVNVEKRAQDHMYEITISVGGYAPVLQRELQATVVLKDGQHIPCERWIAGSSRVVIPEYQPCQGVYLLLGDNDLPERHGRVDPPAPAR